VKIVLTTAWATRASTGVSPNCSAREKIVLVLQP